MLRADVHETDANGRIEIITDAHTWATTGSRVAVRDVAGGSFEAVVERVQVYGTRLADDKVILHVRMDPDTWVDEA